MDDDSLDGPPYEEERGDYHEQANIGIDPVELKQPIAAVHAQHQEFPMGEIDDLHDTEDEGKSDAYESVDSSQQQPINDQLDYRS